MKPLTSIGPLCAVLAVLAAAGAHALDFPVTIESSRKEGGVEVRDVRFPVKGAEGTMTSAYLVRPEAPGAYAGILYFHLFARGSSREQFLAEARDLAGKGVVSVLIQGRLPWISTFRGDKTDLDAIQSQINEAGRALDVLLAEPGVNPSRTAAVGHDYGAMYLLPLLASDARVKYAVLLAFTPRFGDWIKYFSLRVPLEEYNAALAPVDPVTILAAPHRAPCYFQFASSDRFVSRSQVEEMMKKAKQPFTLVWVEDTNHEALSNAGAEARLKWLLPKLGVKRP